MGLSAGGLGRLSPLGGGGDGLVDDHPPQIVGRRHRGGQGVPAVAQVGADREGHGHSSLLFFHLHGGEVGAVQLGAELPLQGEGREQFKKRYN